MIKQGPTGAGLFRGGFLAAFVLLSCTGALACRPQAAETDAGIEAAVAFEPTPPTVGTTSLKVVLQDAAGMPVRVGRLDVEGNMNHAGMKPVFTTLQEGEPGHYTGTIEFTMGGDWFLLLSGEHPPGRFFETKVDVPGVKSK